MGQARSRGLEVLKGMPCEYRIGSGIDVHPFAADRPLIIGGVKIPHSAGLLGESDADVLYHAVADALLGACGCGDLGTHFPPGDPRWKGLDSSVILLRVQSILTERGFSIVNLDSTVIAQQPRLLQYFDRMRANLARLLGISDDRVNVKAKTTDHLGFLGRSEGVAAMATVLLALCSPKKEC